MIALCMVGAAFLCIGYVIGCVDTHRYAKRWEAVADGWKALYFEAEEARFQTTGVTRKDEQ